MISIHRIVCIFLAVAACVGLSTRSTLAQDTNQPAAETRLGIIVVAAINIDEELADEIATRMGEIAHEALLIEPLAGRAMRKALTKPVSERCAAKAACVAVLGRRLSLDTVLFLALIRVGDQIQIEATTASGASGAIKAHNRLRVGDVTDQENIFATSLSDLFPDAKTRSQGPTPDKGENNGPGDGDGDGDGDGHGDGHGDDNGGNGRDGAHGKPGRRMTRAAWIAGGIGAAALLNGLGFGYWAQRTHSDLERDCPGGCPGDPRINDLRTRINVADASLGVALAASVTAGILYYVSGGRSSRNVEAAVSPSSVGFMVTTHF